MPLHEATVKSVLLLRVQCNPREESHFIIPSDPAHDRWGAICLQRNDLAEPNKKHKACGSSPLLIDEIRLTTSNISCQSNPEMSASSCVGPFITGGPC